MKLSKIVIIYLSLTLILISCKTDNSTSPETAAYPVSIFTRSVNYNEGVSSFTIVQLTDTHIGESANYSASYSTSTPPSAGNDGIEADYLRSIVKWINNNKDSYNIKFVIITGDITDTAALWVKSFFFCNFVHP